MARATLSRIMRRGHEVARKLEGNYQARLSYGLKVAWAEYKGGKETAKLNGSAKQISWAEKIRDKMIQGLEELKTAEEYMRYYFDRSITEEEIQTTIEYLNSVDDARFFIDNRSEKGTDIVILVENMKKAEEALKKMKTLELVKLEGSKNQIKWAEKIRDKRLKRLAEIEDWKWNEYYDEYGKDEVIKTIATKITNAKIFIDTKDSLDDLIKEVIK